MEEIISRILSVMESTMNQSSFIFAFLRNLSHEGKSKHKHLSVLSSFLKSRISQWYLVTCF